MTRLLACALVLSGCDGLVGVLAPDAALEPEALDAGALDAGELDGGGIDAGVESQLDAGFDAGSDSGIDAGFDAGVSLRVPAFIAIGHSQRLTLSCDDGRSWVTNTTRPNTPADDHSAAAASAPQGLAYADGVWVANWGWGYDGYTQRSVNGVDWVDTTPSPNGWFGSVAAGDGLFVMGRPRSEGKQSRDGLTWAPLVTPAQWADGVYLIRHTAFVPHGPHGVFFLFHGLDMWASSDGTATWWRPTTIPDVCREQSVVALGNGVIVGLVQGNANTEVCRSSDGGHTWTSVTRDWGGGSLKFIDGQFVYWGMGRRHTSADGLTWTTTPLVGNLRSEFPRVAWSPVSGTFVAVNHVSDASQRAFRSTDGLTWTELAAGDFVRGQLIRYVGFGEIERSATCP